MFRTDQKITAQIFNVSPRTVNRWRADGCPDAGTVPLLAYDGAARDVVVMDPAAVLDWLIETGRDKAACDSFNKSVGSDYTLEAWRQHMAGLIEGAHWIVEDSVMFAGDDSAFERLREIYLADTEGEGAPDDGGEIELTPLDDD